MTPLESDPVLPGVAPFGLTARSFLAIDNPNVVISTWKRAEDGDGSIVRLTEVSGHAQTVHLTTPLLRLEKVQTCSLLEHCNNPIPLEDGDAVFEMQPFTIVTLRLVTSPEKKP